MDKSISQLGKTQRNRIHWLSTWLVYQLIQSPEWQHLSFSENSSQFATYFELVFIFKKIKIQVRSLKFKDLSDEMSLGGDSHSEEAALLLLH